MAMWAVNVWFPQSPVMWVAIAFIVFISVFFGYLTQRSRNRMLNRLAELGHPVTTELVDRIERG
jgi:hypothetical protein